MVLFDARQFSSPKPPGAANLDPFRPEIFGGLQRLFHRTAERNTAFELQRNVFGDELGIRFGVFDFNNIDVNLLASHLAQFLLELVDLGAFASDDNPRAGGENGDATTIGGALDENLGHRGRLELLLQQLANVTIFGKQFAELFLAGVPLGTPIVIDSNAQADWIGFLTHIL